MGPFLHGGCLAVPWWPLDALTVHVESFQKTPVFVSRPQSLSVAGDFFWRNPMMEFFDVEAVRARLAELDVPADKGMAYLQVLTNLNAISILLSPSVDLQDEAGAEDLEQLWQRHQERRVVLEVQFPELAVASRPKGWTGH